MKQPDGSVETIWNWNLFYPLESQTANGFMSGTELRIPKPSARSLYAQLVKRVRGRGIRHVHRQVQLVIKVNGVSNESVSPWDIVVSPEEHDMSAKIHVDFNIALVVLWRKVFREKHLREFFSQPSHRAPRQDVAFVLVRQRRRSHSEPRGRRSDLHDLYALEPSEGQVDLGIKMSSICNESIVFIIFVCDVDFTR